MARLDIELCSPLRHSHFDFDDLARGLAAVFFGHPWFSGYPDLVDQFHPDGSNRLPCLLVLVFSRPVIRNVDVLTTLTSILLPFWLTGRRQANLQIAFDIGLGFDLSHA
jgi:hypothetical protein